MMVFFRDRVGTWLNKPSSKALVLTIFLIYVGFAAWGVTNLKEGLQKRRLSRFDSYSVDFYDAEDKYFRTYPFRINVSILKSLVQSFILLCFYKNAEIIKKFQFIQTHNKNRNYIIISSIILILFSNLSWLLYFNDLNECDLFALSVFEVLIIISCNRKTGLKKNTIDY